MAVPIQNVYYLLCYAWDRLDSLDTVDVGALSGDRIENLLGKVLHDGVSHLMRRGLDRGYLPVEQEQRQLRGKVLLVETAQRLLLQQGRVACRTDELSHDVPHNRVLKAALRELAKLPGIDRELGLDIKELCHRLHDVSDVELGPAAFRGVQLSQNLVRYAFLIEVAKLVASCLLPEQTDRGKVFRSFTSSDQQMGALFEAFVRNFLIREQRQFNVARPKVSWAVAEATSSDPRWLPEMQTDISLSRGDETFIVETKCYADALQQRSEGAPKLISQHLYQLLTYLTHHALSTGSPPLGVLLYAGLGAGQPLHYELGGQTVLVRSLDLDQPWKLIHQDLLALVTELDTWRVEVGTQ
jgi:5-methylcytosine-specific restriction enzyme subunit McrC